MLRVLFLCLGLILMTACSVQETPSKPHLSGGQNLPVFNHPPAMAIKPIQAGPEIPQEVYLIARHGRILNRYQTDQSFNQMFMTGLQNGLTQMQFSLGNASSYTLTANILNLKIEHRDDLPGVDRLSGVLDVHYFIHLNGILIWNRSFETTASFAYQGSQPNQEGQALTGVLQFLINNNIALFANQLNQDCMIKADGIEC